jgi:hypothetical protein
MCFDPKTATTEPRRDWFAVERRVFDDEMFAGDRFSRRDAWLWLVANAARRDHSARTRAGIVELKRGEVIIGRDHLASLWGWTESCVRTFLNQLRQAGRIEYRQSSGHHANVAKISNYERFQSRDGGKSPEGSPVGRQWVASGSPHPYKEQVTEDKGSSGDNAAFRPAKPKRAGGSLNAADRAEAEGAIGDYNTAAAALGFSRCSASDARLTAVAKRLADLGNGDMAAGRGRWREALQAIPHWNFLAGREKPRVGRKPFRLDLERLLSTESGLGDVLAKLLDLHAEHGPARYADQPSRRDTFSAAWAEAQAEELAAQRARWETLVEPEPAGGSDAFH